MVKLHILVICTMDQHSHHFLAFLSDETKNCKLVK